MGKNKSKPIFVSHAAVDKEIADKIVDLLNTAMGINVTEKVFCSSLEGMKIPPGKDFKHFIKEQIQEPKIVLLLISQNYLASQFCLAEVGASWALSLNAIPFLIPPIEHNDMKAVLANVHALKILDPGDWNEALSVFKEALDIDPNISRWERKRDEILENIKQLIPKQKAPDIVPFDKYIELNKKLVDAHKEITELEKEMQRLRKFADDVKKMKNAKEVAEIELESLPVKERFEKLLDASKQAIMPLSSTILEAIYYHFRNESMPWPQGYDHEDELNNIKDAIERNLLYDDEPNGLRVNDEDPKVRRALETLKKLRDFVDKACENEPKFVEAYVVKYDHNLSFDSRNFWEAHLL